MPTRTVAPTPAPHHLRDFAITPRVLLISLLAIVVGAATAGVAWVLVKLIGLFTNVFFFGRLHTSLPSLAHPALPAVARLFLPVAGGLVVGLMARYGSERIRGHGMPETIEVVLTGGSKVAPRMIVLKPLSAAFSIGTGGPFGAEGPVIMTGGAVGSVLAQTLRLTADERKALLCAGSVGGMAAVFDAPLAAVLLAVELLLFELRPRTLLPVVASAATATLVRGPILGHHLLFPSPDAAVPTHPVIPFAAVGVGVAAALIGVVLTGLVYASEDAFGRLPLHWMWWPMIGGLVIGIGGLIAPRALGVGYDTIAAATGGQLLLGTAVAAFVVKGLIWSLSLGSGTSGGVVAPLLFIGATAGTLLGHVLPTAGPGFWAVVAMAAVMSGAMQIPLTAVVFALETTHAWNDLLPILIASGTAFAVSILVLKRSILTEKVARKGFHVSRDYDVDPLEALLVREVMSAEAVVLNVDDDLVEVTGRVLDGQPATTRIVRQRLYPVVDDTDRLVGALTRSALVAGSRLGAVGTVGAAARGDVLTCRPDETCRAVAYRMAEHEVTRLVVVDGADPAVVLGVVGLAQLLAGRLHDLEEERVGERVLRLRRLSVRRRRPADTAPRAPV